MSKILNGESTACMQEVAQLDFGDLKYGLLYT